MGRFSKRSFWRDIVRVRFVRVERVLDQLVISSRCAESEEAAAGQSEG